MPAVPLLVDPANADQARAWDGTEGAFWADHPDAFDRTMAAYDPVLLAAAELHPGEHVLDVGCGTGSTTRAAAVRCAPGHALGVDLSAAMVEVARSSAAGLVNVSFEHVDAQVHDFGAGLYDVLVSRTGVMFFGDPAAAFSNLVRALRPGGRLALLVWQPYAGNEWIQLLRSALAAGRDLPVPGASGPFSLGDPDRVRALLTGAGCTDVALADVRRPMDFGATVDAALDFVTGLLGGLVADLDSAARAAALAALRRTLSDHATPAGVHLPSAAHLVTARHTPDSGHV